MKKLDNSELKEKILIGNLNLHRDEAPIYDQMHGEIFNWYQQRIIRNEIIEIINLSKGNFALDIGCGTGNITLKLIHAGFNVTGVDLSQPMINILKEKTRGKNYSISLVCQDVEPFLKNNLNRYDLITFSSVLHHLSDYLMILEMAINNLNPGGIIYITHEPSGKTIQSVMGRKILTIVDFKLNKLISGYTRPIFDWTYSDYHVYHGFNSNAIIKTIKDKGLKLIKHRFYSSSMQLGIFCVFDNFLFHPESQFSVIAQQLNTPK